MSESPRRRVGVLYRLAGVDNDIENGPAREAHYARCVGGLVLLVWVMQVLLIPFSLHAAFGNSLPFWAYVLAGLIAASLIVGFDMLIIRAGWYSQGLKSLKQAGLVETRSMMESVQTGTAVAVRLILNFATASLIALFVTLNFFASDVKNEITRLMQVINAPLYEDAARRYDERVAAAGAAVQREMDILKALDDEEATLQQRLRDPASGDADVTQLSQEMERLEREKTSFEADAARYAMNKINEQYGQRVTTETGRAGKGTAWDAANAQEERAHKAAERLGERIVAQRQRLETLRETRASSFERTRVAALARLREIGERRQTVQQRHDRAVADHTALLIDREGSIERIVHSQRNAFREPNHGPLEQFNALIRLLHDPGPFAFWLTIKLFIMALELSAVVASMTVLVPTSYAKGIVVTDYQAAVRALRLMEAALQDPASNAAESSDVEAEPPKGDVHNLYDLVRDGEEISKQAA